MYLSPVHSWVGADWTAPPLTFHFAVTAPRLRLAMTATGCGSPYETVNVQLGPGIPRLYGSSLSR